MRGARLAGERNGTQERAGTHRGRSSRSARGSVLVLVIGALALITIIALAYASIGQSDKRSAGAGARRDKIDLQVGQVRDYLAQVIADDALSVVREQVGPSSPVREVREAWDFPSTDPLALAYGDTGATNKAQLRFRPEGSMSVDWPAGTNGPRRSSDPWLMPIEPVYLDAANAGPTDPNQEFVDARDWAQISNFSPNGSFVNLVNLRNNFDAQSGYRRRNNKNQMGFNLSLLDAAGKTTNRLDTGGAYKPEMAAHMGTRQRGAFRPIVDPSNTPGRPQYFGNQWADTDGDGMADARWFEMVDAFDPANPVRLLSPAANLRFVIAARAIDLSGLVNVNTASHLGVDVWTGAAPNAEFPAGASPSDVDLQRVLTLEDAYATLNRGKPAGYDALNPYRQGSGAADYAGYDDQRAPEVGLSAFAALMGARARGAVASGAVQPNQLPAGDVTTGDGTVLLGFGDMSFDADDRWAYYEYFGAVPGGGQEVDESGGATVKVFGFPFTLADELELRSFHAMNDDRSRSRLEAVIGGRSDADAGNVNFSPLRDNRARESESMARDIETLSGAKGADGLADYSALLQSFADARHLVTTASGSRPLAARDVTGGSKSIGAGEQTINLVDLVDSFASGVGSAGDIQDLFLGYARGLMPYADVPDPGNAQQSMLWSFSNSTDYTKRRTLSFGRSPELALRTAAHMAANFAGMMTDGDDSPLPLTLVLDEEYRTNQLTFPLNEWVQDGRVLDFNEGGAHARLAYNQQGPGQLSAPIVNVYPTRPQAFVTDVSVFTFYTDAPKAAGGDEDWQPDGNGGFEGEVTIEGGLGYGNEDFLMQVVAFQLTNPFDETVHLSKDGLGDGQAADARNYLYSLEFGGRTYKVVGYDAAGGSPQGLTLSARESRVVYAYGDDDLAGVAARWAARKVDGVTVLVDAQGIDAFVQRILADTSGTGATPARIMEFSRTTGLLNDTVGTSGPVVIDTVTAANNAEVRLWRAQVSQSRGGESLDDGNVNNAVENDALVDRMRDPNAGASADHTLTSGVTYEVANTENGPDDDAALREDNTSYTLCMWSGFRRPDDPSATGIAGSIPRGALPAFCVEAKGEFHNVQEKDGVTGSPPSTFFSKAFFTGGGEFAAPSIGEMLQVSVSGIPLAQSSFVRTTYKLGSNANNVAYSDLYPRLRFWDYGSNPTPLVRPADVLTAWGVGAWEDPLETDPRLKYTTLSEAMGAALGYDDAFIEHSDPTKPYYQSWVNGVGAFGDGGALITLQRFAPFLDEDANGIFSATGGSSERVMTPGIPLGMNVVNQFRAVDTGGPARSIEGLVNINTAPLNVLRALPMLSPSGRNVLSPAWWWSGGRHDAQSDIAASVWAYREKAAVRPRGAGASEFVSFRDDNDTNTDADGRENAYLYGIETAGSYPSSKEMGLREETGFASVGEVMAVRDLALTGGAYAYPHNMDRLWLDGADTDHAGVDNFRLSGNTADGFDDPAEGMAIANAVLNSITVRSDRFCVWFVVRGYSAQDVEGLTVDQPMLASVERRFVMVVDRSNVTRLGDSPRILLFKELPL